ncbi:MAG: CHC2 zinc finger domain-containing protein [Bacteroidales bacterium]|jgi:hypothetical protein
MPQAMTISKSNLIDPIWEVELEIEWQENLPEYSDWELLDIFPEAKPFYEKELSLLLQVERKLENGARERIGLIKTTAVNEITDWFRNEVVKVWWLKDLLKVKKRIAFLRVLLNPQKPQSGITAQEIENARKNPKTSIWELAQANRAKFTSCPFHKEKTPSMHCWKDKSEVQRFHCFGCGEKGDIIDFLMKTKNMDFSTAVKVLI